MTSFDIGYAFDYNIYFIRLFLIKGHEFRLEIIQKNSRERT
jgi:hypothetical protein